ncbi:MAG: quinone-dependent dihydroorotate dehydrogenase [Rhizobiaceae bacterium]
MSLYQSLLRRLLFMADAETSHSLALLALKSGLPPIVSQINDSRLATSLCGLSFPNPVGLAAGFDKNGEVPDAMLAHGFGFAEVGTLTPRPQAGNPRPRIFRLKEAQGIINRLGFNNQGHEAAFVRLEARWGRGGIVGVNVGANKDSADFTADYVAGIRKFAGVADYFTVNISSPNTPGLRDLQAGAALDRLLTMVLDQRDDLSTTAGRKPVFLKVAPDLDGAQISEIADVVKTHAQAGRLDGLIVSNTTLSRAGVAHLPGASETGGLSGQPLFERSTVILARFRLALGPDMPLIGVGGIDSAHTAAAKMEAGANLVQLYTGMVYRGPAIATEINRGLLEILDQRAINHVSQLVGTKTQEWANRKLPEEL